MYYSVLHKTKLQSSSSHLFQAAEDLDEAIKADPLYHKACFRKAAALKKHGAFADSVRAYSLALVNDPNNAEQLKEKAEAEKCFKCVERARGLMGKNQWTQANSLLDRAMTVREKMNCCRVMTFHVGNDMLLL